jgi:hypothetical protein
MPNHFHGIIFINGRGEASAGMNFTSPSAHAALWHPYRDTYRFADTSPTFAVSVT